MYLQLGTLGAGNHYAEIQVVDEIFNEYAAKKMGIDHKGQVCVMIHSGSRGLGHQVATGIFFGLVLKSTFYGEPYRDLREKALELYCIGFYPGSPKEQCDLKHIKFTRP